MNKLKFCDCTQDGFCPKYQREMNGRFREICAGVNCDLGTSAAFRDQWSREAGEINNHCDEEPIPLFLKNDQAPGDAVVMTAAIYSLHRAYPNKYLTAVDTPYLDVFKYNPDVVPIENIPDALPLQMHYPAIHDSNKRGIHFMQGWCEFLGFALGINVPLLTNRPHLYFHDYLPKSQRDKWLICSGGKSDLTNKLWGQEKYQEVIDSLKGIVSFIQIGANVEDHPPLKGVINLVGKTSLRGLFHLIRECRGIVCGVSLPMHVAAALNKPSIVIAGGREPVQWNSYPKQSYIHTVGMFPCYTPQGEKDGGCWRSRVVPLGDNSLLDLNTCLRPLNGIPECMRVIDAEMVAKYVIDYDDAIEETSVKR